jgi:hypothetical protein
MNHEEQLILYTANQLAEAERLHFEKHLAECAECQADLQLWKAVADEIVTSDSVEHPPVKLVERALEQIRQPAAPARAFRRVAQLLRSQVFLVQREIWPATASVMALGVIVAFVSGHAGFIYFIAPMIAAASLSVLSGPEYDPAHELALSTPTSSWKLLLARLSIVSAYNLVMTLIAMLTLMIAFPPALLGTLALGVLAPMMFLSMLALLLSIWIGTSNAIVISYILWSLQFVAYQSIGEWIGSSAITSFLFAYRDFWHSPMLLLAFCVPLLLIALWSSNRPVFRLTS